ncbi:response regulator receiver protein [Lentinula aciculospora]|uniref:Transcription factor n=1 Tax=Lentinula aciculospora TaxID=153920 RepID=A0A9W9ATY3_9AGAR|nr:response regulator receiver protein [Lentinula aciculospora]
MFKHSNFASFVRQLNKYDFHKVKNTDDNAFGEHSWTFRHPDFHADRRDALENIKRKVPASRKSQGAQNAASTTRPMGSSGGGEYHTQQLQSQVDRLTASHDELSSHIRSLERNIGNLERNLGGLERNYHEVLVEMVGFQRNMAQQDSVMQGLIEWVLHGGGAGGEGMSTSSSPLLSLSNENPFVPSSVAQHIVGPSYRSYIEDGVSNSNSAVDRPPSRLWAAATNAGLINPDGSFVDSLDNTAPVSTTMSPNPSLWNGGAGVGPTKITSRRDALAKIEELQRMRPASTGFLSNAAAKLVNAMESFGSSAESKNIPAQGSQENAMDSGSSIHEGLQVYTVGHLMPKSAIDDMNGTWSFDPGMFGGSEFDLSGNTMVGGQERKADGGSPTMASSSQGFDPSLPSTSQPSTGSDAGSKKLRVRRTAFVPGWAVSPRVLLVDDDAVSRKLGSKFLQVFGCKIDVAVDGVSAVNKMNLEKYDLVLMDIVMPKLDGVSATSLIRKFDHMTPIISMTSNSKPNEIMTYYHSGMNDILPKPFTKQGLLDMLEKHLMHLKVIQQMSRVPRSLGIPPLSDSSFEEAITSQAALLNMQSSSYSFNPMRTDDDDMGRLNPLAGMGLSDEQYNAILTGIVNGETFSGSMDMGGYGNETPLGGIRMDAQKRRLDDQDDGRAGKRSRFEVIE